MYCYFLTVLILFFTKVKYYTKNFNGGLMKKRRRVNSCADKIYIRHKLCLYQYRI